MVGSNFILTKRNGDNTLLNIAEIVSAYTENIDLHSTKGRLIYKHYSTEQGLLYTVQLLLTGRRDMEYIFATAADRDAFYEQITAAISPAVIIEITAPKVPVLPDRLNPNSNFPALSIAKSPRKPRSPRE